MASTLLLGDSRGLLAAMEPGSVSAIVTDPPYEINFMGTKDRNWDRSGISYDPEFWALCLRVLSPGGHLVSFGACRTYHRIACAIEDAGFEIRDSLFWNFGSGFPKSLNISKAIDGSDARHKQHERRLRFTKYMREAGILTATINELTGTQMGSHYTSAASQPAIMTRDHFEAVRHLLTPQSLPVPTWIEQAIDQRTVESENMKARQVTGHSSSGMAGGTGEHCGSDGAYGYAEQFNITAPATPEAQQWDGWGSALKPSFEPIVLARKPLSGTIAETVLEYGTGGLNIDATRVGDSGGGTHCTNRDDNGKCLGHNNAGMSTSGETFHGPDSDGGRWPPNVLLSPETAAKLGGKASYFPVFDYGGEDRFFYAPKASREEREAGCEHLPGRTNAEAVDREPGSAGANNPRAGAGRENGKGDRVEVRNFHPT